MPDICLKALEQVLLLAKQRGTPVRPNNYLASPTSIPSRLLPLVQRKRPRESEASTACPRCGTVLPLELFGLGRCPSCVDYDGPRRAKVDAAAPCAADTLRALVDSATAALVKHSEGSASSELQLPSVDTARAMNQLLHALNIKAGKLSSQLAIMAALDRLQWPAKFPTDQKCWEAYGASRSNFHVYVRMLKDALGPARPTIDQLVEQVPLAWHCATECAAQPQAYFGAECGAALLCPRCGSLLPLELFGLGRCPSCADYDGPGRYAAALSAARPATQGALQRSAASGDQKDTSHSAPTRLQRARAALLNPTTPAAPPSPYRAHRAVSHRRGSAPVVADSSSAMPTVDAAGQLFVAPRDRHRLTTRRKRDMLGYAHLRATQMAGATATPEQVERLRAAVVATHELAEYGAATGTLDKDDHAWDYWARFCDIYGWDPIISSDLARNSPHEVSQRLAIFQAWVYPQLKGLKQPDAKPRTVFNSYVLAIIRILNREHIPMPNAKHVERNLAGIMRTFKAIYGHEALMPGRKQPFTPAMWARIEALQEGTLLSGRAPWSPLNRLRDRNLLRLGRVLWRTGHRLGEIVWHPSGEINYLTRACVSITKANGGKIANPTASDWRSLTAGDCVLLAPCTSKSDQFGEEHCPFPSIIPFDGTDASAAAAIRDVELQQPCAPHARRTTPLFCDDNMQPFTYEMLHRDLRSLLVSLFGASFASAFSWHSVRIGLACALHAADCPDAHIQLICRWASPDSLKVYRQMGIEKNVFWVGRAQTVTFDATRVNNLPALDGGDHMLEQVRTFADPVERAALHDASSPAARATPARAVRSYVIPGGTVQAYASDLQGIIGLAVTVPRSFWQQQDVSPHEPARIACTVAAECVREFLHADGTRTPTYLLAWGSQYFPIKRDSLIRVVLTSAQRTALDLE